MPHSALDEYLTRIRARREARDRLNQSDARLSQARLTVFLTAVVLAVLAWRIDLSLWLLLAPGVAFAWLVRRHDQIIRARDAATRAIAFYDRGVARIEDRWMGGGEPGDRFRDDRHVYANDLDLFGKGSLFELLSLARTRAGEATLARWLTTPADAAEIHVRQEAVAELSTALDLREEIALAGAHVRAAVRTDRLLEWAEAPPVTGRGALRAFTGLFTALAAAALLSMAMTPVRWPLFAVIVLQAGVFARLRRTMEAIVSGGDRGDADAFVADALTNRVLDLEAVSGLLNRLERESFGGQRLTLLRGRLSEGGLNASQAIGQLGRLAGIRDSTANLPLVPVGLFLVGQIELALSAAIVLQLVGPYIALAVDRWRRRHGGKIRVWLDTVADFEALSSLAGYRYEHAGDPFPIVVPADAVSGRPVFEGAALGHPLLPAAGMVRNDVHLGGDTQLFVVSGSNMSGKSTLLRTVGINAVLALAGAPVRASSLRMTPLAVGATLRIQDSLQEGRSRFYAEITRIRALADLAAGPLPLLFLLDELFHGTNSHDRLVGATGVLRSLLDRGALGLITTHDMALTAVARDLAPRAENVHFEDRFEGDELTYDFRLKPGPVTHSNALALMRAVGLTVPDA